MNRIAIRAIGAAFVLLSTILHAQVPQLIDYQGRVVVGTVNFNGSGSFKFALVNAAANTTYWSNDGSSTAGSQPTNAVSLTVTKGLYSVLLGDTTLANMIAIPASVFNNSDVRLRVWFNDGANGSQLLAPDQRIAAVGYAMIAGNVPDGAITSAKLASGLTLAGTTAGVFSGDGSGLTNLPAARFTPLQVALLKWGVSLADNTVGVGSNPEAICFDGASIWVANNGASNVTKLNASTGAVIGTYGVGSGPAGICFDGISIWVANNNSSDVTKVNANTGATIGTYTVGTNPVAACYDGANIWVANSGSNNVTKLNASTGAVIGTYNVGTSPDAVCYDGASIWVSNNGSNNVTKLTASSGAVVGTYNVATGPDAVCYDGANIWVANSGSNNVTKLNASTGATVGTYGVGTFPQGICYDGASIWVANLFGNNVTKLNAITGATVGTYAVGTHPIATCFDGASIWVTNLSSNNVTKL